MKLFDKQGMKHGDENINSVWQYIHHASSNICLMKKKARMHFTYNIHVLIVLLLCSLIFKVFNLQNLFSEWNLPNIIKSI